MRLTAKSAIAGALGLHRRTLAKWLASAQYRRRPSPPRASRLDPFKAQVVRLLQTHPYSAQQVFQRLREAGFDGCYTSVKDCVRKVRPPRREAYLKLSFAPGESALKWTGASTARSGLAPRGGGFPSS